MKKGHKFIIALSLPSLLLVSTLLLKRHTPEQGPQLKEYTSHNALPQKPNASTFPQLPQTNYPSFAEDDNNPPTPAVDKTETELKAWISQQWKDPAWRASMLEKKHREVESQFGAFIQSLGIEDQATLEAVRDTMAMLKLEEHEANATTSPNPSEEEYLAQEHLIQSIQERHEIELANLIGEEATLAYKSYKNAQPYKSEVDEILGAMKARGAQLDNDLELAILYTFAEQSEKTFNRSDFETTIVDSDHMSTDQIDDIRNNQVNELDISLTKELSKILNQRQLELFIESRLSNRG